MKRRAITVARRGAVFMLLGAMVNGAVAWGCVPLVEMNDRSPVCCQVADALMIHAMMFQGFGSTFVATVSRHCDLSPISLSPPELQRGICFHPRDHAWAALPSWGKRRIIELSEDFQSTDFGGVSYWSQYVTLQARGWPMRCLWAERRLSHNSGLWELLGGYSTRAPIATKPGHPLYLDDRATYPCQVWWPGFAINTTFYAAIFWLVFAAPGRVRCWRRIKRDLCPACAYPVGKSATCTECGSAVKPRRGKLEGIA